MSMDIKSCALGDKDIHSSGDKDMHFPSESVCSLACFRQLGETKEQSIIT